MTRRPLTKEQLRALACRALGNVGVKSLAGTLAIAIIEFCDAPAAKPPFTKPVKRIILQSNR